MVNKEDIEKVEDYFFGVELWKFKKKITKKEAQEVFYSIKEYFTN